MVDHEHGQPYFDWYPISRDQHCLQYHPDKSAPFEDISCNLAQYGSSSSSSSSSSDESTQHRPLTRTLAIWLSKSYQTWEFEYKLTPPSPQTVAATILMSALIVGWGKVYMSRHRAVQMRSLVMCWNALWGVINCVGFCRLAPLAILNAVNYSIETNVCGPPQTLWMSGTTGLWGVLWIYIKLVEIVVEAVLMVVLKEPCSLLQWFNSYAYIPVHGYHLVFSRMPGGVGVLAIYYGVVAITNAYCFHLNWNHLTVSSLQQPPAKLQPINHSSNKYSNAPMILLGLIQVIQNMSGATLSVITLYFWKQAVQDPTIACNANERHIRILAFSWSGGQVIIFIINKSIDYIVMKMVQLELRKHREERHAQRRRRTSVEAKTVSFANIKGKVDKTDGGKDRRVKTEKKSDDEQLTAVPDLVEEADVPVAKKEKETTIRRRIAVQKDDSEVPFGESTSSLLDTSQNSPLDDCLDYSNDDDLSGTKTNNKKNKNSINDDNDRMQIQDKGQEQRLQNESSASTSTKKNA